MPLNDVKVRNAKPTAKPFKLSDSGGLFLLVQPSGSKWWRYKYRFAGKEKLLALGAYPDVSVADARERHSQARKALAAGNDPSELKKEAKRLTAIKAENTMEGIAREWHEQHVHEWAAHYAKDVINRLETHIFPKLGNRPIADIEATEILAVLKIIEKSGALDMAQRMQQTCGQVFRYAIITGRTKRNPIADLRGALKTPVRKHHAYLKADDLPEYLQKLDAYQGELQTKLALKMLLLTFVRTSELRGAEWQEVNFDKAEWRIPAARMKMKDPHIVPLPHQAITILRELQKHTGNRQHLFPNQHKPANCMSENTMIYALYRMGYHSRTTGHGFRATASTILNEHGFPPDVIERQLQEARRLGIPEKEHRFYIKLEQAKANMSAPMSSPVYYKRHGQIIGETIDNPDGESIGILLPVKFDENTSTKLSIRNAKLLQLIEQAAPQYFADSSGIIRIPRIIIRKELDDYLDHEPEKDELATVDAKSEALRKGLKFLKAKNKIVAYNPTQILFVLNPPTHENPLLAIVE